MHHDLKKVESLQSKFSLLPQHYELLVLQLIVEYISVETKKLRSLALPEKLPLEKN